MPAHEDAVDRPGNLSDAEYEAARTARIIVGLGVNPDLIPADILAAAEKLAGESA